MGKDCFDVLLRRTFLLNCYPDILFDKIFADNMITEMEEIKK